MLFSCQRLISLVFNRETGLGDSKLCDCFNCPKLYDIAVQTDDDDPCCSFYDVIC